MAPLIRAAVGRGHQVALVTGGGMARVVAEELPPAVEHLPAGPMPAEFLAEAARRVGHDVMNPTPDEVGEIFAATRIDLTAEEAIPAGSEWKPDVVVAESYDAVGPLLAAVLDVPWYEVGLGPAMPAPFAACIAGAAAPRYAARGARPVPPRSYVDPCPALLQGPEWAGPAGDVRHWPVRPEAHRRPGATWTAPDFTDSTRPRVLVTLGTIFSEPELLRTVVDAVTAQNANALVTLGFGISRGPVGAAPAGGSADRGSPDASDGAVGGTASGTVGEARYVPFAPIRDLLDGVDAVVGVGGSGTVLAALSHGVPMVLWPQGADQPITAARTEAAGVSVVADSPATVSSGLARILADDRYRAAAKDAAERIATLPSPADVLDALVAEAGAGAGAGAGTGAG
ncbi:nucleotide disphospho-sugar-binding domain-containing protein [Streptomyces sp. NPDC093085]|uniref:glycosyltransferase n=1 Tax=Streptomyces sp. NPDC093085 TaxID=3155068 RepID=UPI00341F176D